MASGEIDQQSTPESKALADEAISTKLRAVLLRACIDADPGLLRAALRQVASAPAQALPGLLSRYWRASGARVIGTYLFAAAADADAFRRDPGADHAVTVLADQTAAPLIFAEPVELVAPAILERPVFILAAPRTGSTLLFDTLAAAAEMWTVGGESHGLFEGIPSLHPGARNFASHRLTAAQASSEVTTALRLSVTAELRDERGRRWMDLAPGERPLRPRWLEKTPENALRIPFLRAAFPGAQFIVLTREAPDTVTSIAAAWENDGFVNLVDVPGIPVRGWSFLLPDGWRSLRGASLQEVACAQYRAAYEAILAGVCGLPRERWTVVRYEEVVRQPSATLSRIGADLGLPISRQRLERAIACMGISATALSAPARGKSRWADDLPAATKETLAEIETRLVALAPGGSPPPMSATVGVRSFLEPPRVGSAVVFRCHLPGNGAAPDLTDPIIAPGLVAQIGTMPLALRRRARFRERIADDAPIVWVAHEVTGVLTPWWLPRAYASLAAQLRPGARPWISAAHPLFASLASAGIVTDESTMREDREKLGRELARSRQEFVVHGVSLLPPLLHDQMRLCLGRYYTALLAEGNWLLGDEQVTHRHGWHDETMARFVHYQLQSTIEMVTGMSLKPSYCYVSAYRASASLAPHIDREQCEITVSLLLERGGAITEPWPLIVETVDGPHEIECAPGQAVLFLGSELPHYRQGNAAQRTETVLLLHYVRKSFDHVLH